MYVKLQLLKLFRVLILIILCGVLMGLLVYLDFPLAEEKANVPGDCMKKKDKNYILLH